MARTRRAPLHRLIFISITVGITAFAISPPLLAGGAQRGTAELSTAAPLLTEAEYNAAVETFIDARAQAVRRIDSARADIAATELAWRSSAATLGEGVARTDLRRQLDSGLNRVDRAMSELERANTRTDFSQPTSGRFPSRPDLATQTTVLESIRFDRAAGLATLQQSLTTAERVVTEAVAAWHREQARLAAEEAARVEAARVEAARVEAARAAEQPVRSAPSAAGARRPAMAPASVSFSKLVWTAGWQNEIDACQGAVDIGAHYGVPVIAEHWSCGGSQFPREGSTVTLTGAASGVFLVGSVAAVLNVATDTAADVPHGFDLLYQTCINDSSATMSFTELIRIG